MRGNSFGKAFEISSFGESHGLGIGVVVNGCPAGLDIDLAFVQEELSRRRPGQSHVSTTRAEKDLVQVLSGVFEGKATGAPIALWVPNTDQKSQDYGALKDVFRPSHADFTYQEKFGIRDYRGGGRSSARETIARVAAGSLAKLFLRHYNIKITAFTSQIGEIRLNQPYTALDLSQAENSIVRCPSPEIGAKMVAAIEQAKLEGDSLGGIITCVVSGVMAGLGEPAYDRLEADLAKAMLSINATKGFEIGGGFAAAAMKGSQHNDAFFTNSQGKVETRTNFSGGVQGGISNGQDIYFNTAFKPTATIAQRQETIDKNHQATHLEAQGRHDPCVVPRAVPIVEAMAAIVIADHILRQRTAKM